jgi:hypothetical protein
VNYDGKERKWRTIFFEKVPENNYGWHRPCQSKHLTLLAGRFRACAPFKVGET